MISLEYMNSLTTYCNQQWSSERKSNTDEAYILHNTRCNLKKSEYYGELCQYKGKCFQCRRLVQSVRSLLNELTDIKENQVVGFCQHCKSTSGHKCPRCEYIVSKFMADKARQCEERQRRFKIWLFRVKLLLQAILDGSVCKYRVDDDPNSCAELQYLLKQLKAPLTVHKPISRDLFPIERDLTSLQSVKENKDMIDELILKLKRGETERCYSSEVNLSPTPSKMCICKYFKDKDFGGVLSEIDFIENDRRDGDSFHSYDVSSTGMTSAEKLVREQNFRDRAYRQGQSKRQQISSRDVEKSKSDRTPGTRASSQRYSSTSRKIKGQGSATAKKREKGESAKEAELVDGQKKGEEKKHKITGMTEEDKMFFKLMKDMKAQRQGDKGSKRKEETKRRATYIGDLPELIKRDISIDTESWSFVKCEKPDTEPAEMIKGECIVPYYPHYKDVQRITRVPLLFEVSGADAECPTPMPTPPLSVIASTVVDESTGKTTRLVSVNSENLLRAQGAFHYELSNRRFIDNGVTQLPSERVMRKMNIYKMTPLYPNWFDRNKSLTKYYDTGEILAEVDDDGTGKWYYKNGDVALDYHKTKECVERYIVYSCGVDPKTCRRRLQTVLACFDFHGNGVVYDHHGNIRVKYNQTEGLIVDKQIAPPGKWKWHDLNDPPVLEHVFINTNLERPDPILESLQTKHEEKLVVNKKQQEQESLMMNIELENYVREEAEKLLQKFKPFQIRIKAVKLNEQFALKIMDQAHIRLLFRETATSLTLNVGLKLLCNEIIDIDSANLSEVETPYDKHPPRSTSISNIQKMIGRVREENKTQA